MNTIGLLLVLGLALFAMKQKSEKTRNMLLVVSALLGFCMFSAEGFTDITFDAGGSLTAGGTVTTADQAVYTFPPSFVPASPETLTEWACPAGKVKAPLSGAELAVAAPAADPLTLDNINSVYPCNDATPAGQACSEAKSGGKACPDYYQDKIADCSADPCVAGDFSGPGTCCEKVCPDADCKDWLVFGLGSGERQECKEELPLGFLKYYCNEDS